MEIVLPPDGLPLVCYSLTLSLEGGEGRGPRPRHDIPEGHLRLCSRKNMNRSMVTFVTRPNIRGYIYRSHLICVDIPPIICVYRL